MRVARAALQDVPLEIAAVGNVEAIERVEVKSRVGGQIRSVAFDDGQEVRKGQLLFTVDREALSRQETQQQAELDRDLAMEQQATSVAARDATLEKQRRSEAEIAVKLGELGVLSGQSVRQAVSTSEAAHSGVRADEAAIAAAASAAKADQAHLAQTRLQINFTDVLAPISGRAGEAMARTGNIVRENDTTLVTLLQTAPIHITFGVPEQSLTEVRRLNAIGPLEVEAGISDSVMVKGVLNFVDNSVDATTGTIRLRATFPNADGALWPGEFVPVRLRLKVEPGKIVIPESAVRQGVDGQYVWRVESNVATMLPVSVERSYRQQAADGRVSSLAVLANGRLRQGDGIVSEGQLRLTPGARINVIGDGR